MPRAIIAGMPNNKARELRQRIEKLATHQTWCLAWIPSRQNQAGLRTVWGDVKNVADGADAPGSHILAYHKSVSGRGRYEQEVRFRHRLIWLDHSLLYQGSGDEWWRDIEEKLQLEETWREHVRPPSRRHALILPRGTFASKHDPWVTAQRAETERDVARAHGQIKGFGEDHRQRAAWRDQNDLLFDPGGPEHGRVPLSRQWKFTYQLGPGFHFDVRHERGRSFTVTDANGDGRSFREYTNVDSHGHLRGGK